MVQWLAAESSSSLLSSYPLLLSCNLLLAECVIRICGGKGGRGRDRKGEGGRRGWGIKPEYVARAFQSSLVEVLAVQDLKKWLDVDPVGPLQEAITKLLKNL